MDWTRSYESTWRVFRVNEKTWADGAEIRNVDSAKISRTADGSLLETGSLVVTGDFETGYYRIVMTADQDGELTRVDVGTLYFQASGGETNFGRTAYDVDGSSVLYPAYTTTVIIGEYAPAGADGAQYAASLLRGAINAPVEVHGGFTLNDHVVHELGAAVIEAVWAVLDAGGFVIQIDGKGIVHILPKPTEPSLTINSSSIGRLSNGIDFSADKSDIPNRYIVIDGNNVTIAVNDDPASEVSTVRRGFFVDVVDTSPTPVNGKTMAEYAHDRLKAMSIMRDERKYTREYAPDVYLYSIVRSSISGLQGDLRVLSQSIRCSNGISVSEKAAREIALW